MACGLNTINDPNIHFTSYVGLLGPASDMYQVAERINLWWGCFILARRLATVTGLSDGLDNFPYSVS